MSYIATTYVKLIRERPRHRKNNKVAIEARQLISDSTSLLS